MGEAMKTVVLEGTHVRLEPLQLEHVGELAEAASGDRSTFGFTNVPDGESAMAVYAEQLVSAHRNGEVLPFVQRSRATGRLVGCTRYMEPRHWRGRAEPDELEIGGTWLSSAAQRTGINTEAKYLLLRHAFEVLDVWRLQICTDARNEQSRAAIERIGASFEGVLRSHRPRYDSPTPAPRDSALYAITAADWPGVRTGLEARLATR